MIEIVKTNVPAAVELSENGGITAVSVSAHYKEGAFDADCAVRLTIRVSGNVTARMATVLYSPFWCRPDFGASLTDVPVNTQALLWRLDNGSYGFLLPMSTGDYVTSLEGADGALTAVVRSGCGTLRDCETTALIAGEGRDPYALLEQCAREAARRVGGGFRVRADRRYPEIFEYLGWCTWDAMEIWVNEDETLEKCREFREKKIPVRWAILDDMWADIEWAQKLPRFTPHSTSFGVMHASKMNDYEADPERFPHGLAGCIERMHEYGMRVGIWHPTSGYWAGLVPGGKADEKLRGTTAVLPNGRILPDLSDPAHTYAFYARMHEFFAACGAEFVKIDNQSFLRANYRDAVPLGRAAHNLYAGAEASVGKYFDGAIINCMGMASENMFGRATTAVSRCSDDFQPENRAWFAKHVMQCAYNGLVQGQFCVNDWDMWWSDDEQAVKNSVLRAISGGPIYVSDRLGRSRPEIFEPLCFSDGRILRPDQVAVPTEDCLLTDMAHTARPLKVMNMAGRTAYVAAFHLKLEDQAIIGTLSPRELRGLHGDRFLLYEYFSGEWKILTAEEIHAFTLNGADDFRLFSLTPVTDGTAVVGDARKFISVRAVTHAEPGRICLREGGLLKFYSEKPVSAASDENGTALPLTCEGGFYTVDVPASVREVCLR